MSTALWSDHSHELGHSQNSIELLLFSMKNLLSSLEMDATWIWYGCSDESKILHIVCSKSVITTIFEMPGTLVARLMPYLIAKSSVSENKTFTAWWIVLIMSLLWIWIWAMEVVILFLILASVITRAWEESSEEEIIKSFSKNEWDLKDSLLFCEKRSN